MGLSILQVLRNPLVHAASHTTFSEPFSEAIFPNLVVGLFHINPHRQGMMLVLKAIFDLLGDVGNLVLSGVVLMKACLLWGNYAVLF